MSLFFRQNADIEVIFDGADTRQSVEIKNEDGRKEKRLLYYDGETVSGKVIVTLKKPGTKLEHQGIRVSFIGLIELNQDRGNHHEFTSLIKELIKPGELTHNASYPFEFTNVEKSNESYCGRNVHLRYFIRVTIFKKLSPNIVKESEIIVHTLASYPEVNSPIKMEVGIEDCLHIEFEYNKSKYHLKDVIVGKIYFLLVRIKIKHMEIAIIKKETTGINPNTYNENETIAKYEIMDGAPVRGESIPIRLFLGGYELTPTLKEIHKKFSVKYYLNLVIVDEEDRRYFKQQEIVLWRKGDKIRKLQQNSANHFQVTKKFQSVPTQNPQQISPQENVEKHENKIEEPKTENLEKNKNEISKEEQLNENLKEKSSEKTESVKIDEEGFSPKKESIDQEAVNKLDELNLNDEIDTSQEIVAENNKNQSDETEENSEFKESTEKLNKNLTENEPSIN